MWCVRNALYGSHLPAKVDKIPGVPLPIAAHGGRGLSRFLLNLGLSREVASATVFPQALKLATASKYCWPGYQKGNYFHIICLPPSHLLSSNPNTLSFLAQSLTSLLKLLVWSFSSSEIVVVVFFSAILFSILAAPICIPTKSVQGFPFLHILPKTCHLVFLMIAIQQYWYEVISSCGFDLHFPDN